jgi:hypothetical protein
MLTASTFGLGIKIIGLAAIAAILLSASFSMGIQSSYAQFGAQTQQESQGAVGQQVLSNGGLTATLNGNRFTTGDRITLTGCIEERDTDSSVMIQVIDPNNDFVEISSAPVTEAKTFTYSFQAGMNRANTLHPMTVNGNYKMTVSYLTPNFDRESVELAFTYHTVALPGQNTSEQISHTESPYSNIQNTTDISSSNAKTCPGMDGTFIEENTGFAANLPQGWIVDDFESLGGNLNLDSTLLVRFCPESETQPNAPEFSSQCSYTDYLVDVERYNQLDRDLGASTPQEEITSEELMAHELQRLQAYFGNFDILSHEIVPVNISSMSNNGQQINRTLDGTLISLNYSGVANPDGYLGHRLYFVDGIYGYVVSYEKRLSPADVEIDRTTIDSMVPEPVKQLMTSVSLQSPTTSSSGSDNDNAFSIGGTTSSTSSPYSSSSRCPDGYHRSPSGDCERVTDTSGMPRCPNGYHRSPDGDCEYVG